jgi:hypothetical protein
MRESFPAHLQDRRERKSTAISGPYFGTGAPDESDNRRVTLNKATNVLLICVLALMATACNGQKQSASENAPSDASPPNDLPFAVGSSTVFIHDFTRAYEAFVAKEKPVFRGD